MPLDHSALTEPVAITRSATGAAATAVVVTPPVWAQSVDIIASGGAVLVGTSGTEGGALTAYVTVADGTGYNLPLQAAHQARNAVPYLVQTATTAITVEFAYLPRRDW